MFPSAKVLQRQVKQALLTATQDEQILLGQFKIITEAMDLPLIPLAQAAVLQVTSSSLSNNI